MLRLLAAAAVCCSLTGCQENPSLTVAIPQSMLQEGVNLYFPVTSKQLLQQETPVLVTLTDATALLEKGRDEVGLKIDLQVEPGSQPPALLPMPLKAPMSFEKTSGSFNVWGKILYRPEEASFYLFEPTFEEMDLAALPEELREPTVRAIEQMLAAYLREHSVYTLSDSNEKTKAAKMVLKSLAVEDGTLYVELGP